MNHEEFFGTYGKFEIVYGGYDLPGQILLS